MSELQNYPVIWVDGLVAENERLKTEATLLKITLGHCRKKLELYRDHSDGQYQGGIEHTALIRMIDASMETVSDSQDLGEKMAEPMADRVTADSSQTLALYDDSGIRNSYISGCLCTSCKIAKDHGKPPSRDAAYDSKHLF